MNVVDCVRDHCKDHTQNNAEYFSGPGRMGLKAAFDLYVKRRGMRPEAMTLGDALSFAAANAMTTLEWNVGDVVQVNIPGNPDCGRYATVDSFGERAYATGATKDEASTLYLLFAGCDTLVAMCAHHVRKPDFPTGLVELVKHQMRASCPLTEPGCRP